MFWIRMILCLCVLLTPCTLLACERSRSDKYAQPNELDKQRGWVNERILVQCTSADARLSDELERRLTATLALRWCGYISAPHQDALLDENTMRMDDVAHPAPAQVIGLNPEYFLTSKQMYGRGYKWSPDEEGWCARVDIREARVVCLDASTQSHVRFRGD